MRVVSMSLPSRREGEDMRKRRAKPFDPRRAWLSSSSDCPITVASVSHAGHFLGHSVGTKDRKAGANWGAGPAADASRSAPEGGVRDADSATNPRAEGALRADQFGLQRRDNVRRLCCRADRAPGAAPTVFALGFKCLRRARGPRPGQYQPLVVAHRIFQGTAWYRRNERRMRSEPGRSRGVLSRGF